jgi:large subunit ribosomal protein L4
MNKEINILDTNGNKVDVVFLDENKIEMKKGSQAVYDSVRTFLAAQRKSHASTKTRSTITGGGCKPFKQKGLGRARAGTIRSPLWRHGAVTFGPLPERNYKHDINKKVQKLALKRAFSEKLAENKVLIVQNIGIESGKTKDAAAALKKINAGKNTLIVSSSLSDNTKRALRNIPKLSVETPARVNTYAILACDKILFDKGSFQKFIEKI